MMLVKKCCELSLLVVVVCCAATDLHAAIVAEMTFQTLDTVPNPDQTNITQNKPGSSNRGELMIDAGTPASINPTGSTGLGIDFQSEVRTGYLSAPQTTSGGVVSINTLGSNGTLNNYISSTAGLGSGSVYTVFKPNFNGDTGRNAMFSHNVQGASQLWLFAGEGTNKASFLTGNSFLTLSGFSSFSWDSTKWYLFGGSWQDTAAGVNLVDRTMNIYLRELDQTMPSALTNTLSSNGVSQALLVGSPFFVGRRSNAVDEAARGDIALFRMYDEFFSIADFDAQYNSLFFVPAPEPSSGLLMAYGACGLLMRRRRALRRGA